MTTTPAEPTTPAEQEPPAAATTPAEPQAQPETPAEDIPAVIKALREDFKAERARRQAAEESAANAKNDLAQTIGKALGLVQDEAIDPAKLTESLTAAQNEAKQAQVALAVYQNAGAAGGDPLALLDSTAFLKAVAGVDPSDSAAVQAAIETAVAANPRLGAAAPAEPRTPAPNPAQGLGDSGSTAPSQLTEADVKRLSAEGKVDEIEKARLEGRLSNLMGVKP